MTNNLSTMMENKVNKQNIKLSLLRKQSNCPSLPGPSNLCTEYTSKYEDKERSSQPDSQYPRNYLGFINITNLSNFKSNIYMFTQNPFGGVIFGKMFEQHAA